MEGDDLLFVLSTGGVFELIQLESEFIDVAGVDLLLFLKHTLGVTHFIFKLAVAST